MHVLAVCLKWLSVLRGPTMYFEDLSVVAFDAVRKGCKNSKPEGVKK